MVQLIKLGLLGKIGGMASSMLSPIFGPLITTLVNMFGGDSAGVAIRNSTATMRVYDSVAGSILKTVAINEHRPEGHRVVENELPNPETPSLWSSGAGTTWSGNVGTFPASGWVYNTATFTADSGSKKVARVELSGSGVITVKLYYAGDLTLLSITLSSTPTIYTLSTVFTANRPKYFLQFDNLSGSTVTMTVHDTQAEDVTGLSNQNPSEYVGGTGAGPFRQVFTTENANTVAGNVVTEATGNPLFPTKTIDSFPWNQTKPDWSAGVTYAAGAEVNHGGSWYSTVAGGTDAATFGDTVTWVNQGIYSANYGLLVEPAATNQFLQSDTPATQTITLAVGTYTCWLDGVGGDSITSSAGTAVGIGFGLATPTTPNAITITTGGTVVYTVAGAPIRAQVETGSVPTSYIPTTTAAVTRATEAGNINWPITGNFNNAEGTMVCEFIPANAKHTSSVSRGIVGVGTSSNSLAYMHWNNGTLVSFDGTNAVQLTTAYNAEPITIAVRWSTSLNQLQVGILLKGQYGSAWSWGAATAYDGAFTLGTLIQLAVGMDEPITFRNNPLIYGKALTTTEIEAKFT